MAYSRRFFRRKTAALSEPDPLNIHDRDQFLDALGQKLPEPLPLNPGNYGHDWHALGEVLAMCWENLDVRNCQYNVSETTRQGGSAAQSGKRLIDLDPHLVAKLEAHIKEAA